jgi:hypothetical protein
MKNLNEKILDNENEIGCFSEDENEIKQHRNIGKLKINQRFKDKLTNIIGSKCIAKSSIINEAINKHPIASKTLKVPKAPTLVPKAPTLDPKAPKTSTLIPELPYECHTETPIDNSIFNPTNNPIAQSFITQLGLSHQIENNYNTIDQMYSNSNQNYLNNFINYLLKEHMEEHIKLKKMYNNKFTNINSVVNNKKNVNFFVSNFN